MISYLKHRSKLSVADASCIASIAAVCAESLSFMTSWNNQYVNKNEKMEDGMELDIYFRRPKNQMEECLQIKRTWNYKIWF